MGNKKAFIIFGSAGIIILVGIGIGYLVSAKKTLGSTASSKSAAITNTKTEAGIADTSAFKDTATGTLKAGGIKGEGSFHLERPGGASQNVYLTSTVIDMSPFVGKKVQVWGQTQAGQHAGWFMDVGKIKVVE